MAESEHSTEFLVVGGGVSGLAFAGAIADRDYLLCEAEAELGGYCRTVHRDGFVWDYSGHFFHFRHPEIERELVERIGRDRVRKIAKRSFIYYRDRWIDFPFQKNIHQLDRQEFIDCLVDLVGTLDSPDATAPENFKQMLYQRLGRGICERFLIPYNEKLYATDLAQLDVDAMGRFFPHANVQAIVRNFRDTDNSSYNSTFTYPEGGAMDYIHALAAKVDEARISLRERVLHIDLDAHCATTNKRQIRYRHLVSSAPFPRLLTMLNQSFERDLYSYNKVLVFNLGFDAKGPRDVHWIYYPQRDLCFYRVGFYDNIFDSERMSLYVELGFPAHEPLDAARIEAWRQRVLGDLKRANLVQDQRLVAWHSVVLDPAYVHLTRASNRAVAELKPQFADRGIHSIGRYGSWTYCAIEDNIVEARSLARALTTEP